MWTIVGNKEEITLDTCNEVEPAQLIRTLDYVNTLNNCSNDELDLKCLEILQDESNPGGLGLINVAQYCRPLKIEANQVNGETNIPYLYVRTKFKA